jgi:ABC-type polysaccharide/polyol phosphate export permease
VWFSLSSIESANVLMINGNLIKKILFPAEVLPVVTVTANLVHFLFGLPIVLIFIPILGRSLTPYLLLLPVVILVQYVFSLGLSLLISSLTVHFRDIKDDPIQLADLLVLRHPDRLSDDLQQHPEVGGPADHT